MLKDELFIEEVVLKKDKRRGDRRKKNIAKALRKLNLSRSFLKSYGYDWYDNLHQYSKNKIHCSCNLCRFRPVWDPDQKTASDMRREAHMKFLLNDYVSDDLSA